MPQTGNGLSREVSRFAIIGALNTFVGVAVIFLFYKALGFGLVTSNAAGYGVGLVLSFALNGSWTFGSSTYNLHTVIKYFVLVCAAFTINILIIQLFTSFGLAYWAAQLVGVFVYSLLVFLGMKYVIFTTCTRS
jgi:putative flippase GtrA